LTSQRITQSPCLTRFQNVYKAPGARSTEASKGRLCPLSHPPCTFSSLSCLSASLTDMRPTVRWPDLLAVLNSSFRWRDHLRLIAFHPLLVRSFGGLARGACIVIVIHIICAYFKWLSCIVIPCTRRRRPTDTGTFLFRAHQTALSSSGMRASADELSAWEALTAALVVRTDNLLLFIRRALLTCVSSQGCVRRLDR